MKQAQEQNRLLFLVRDSRYFLSHRLPLALASQSAGLKVAVACSLQSKQDLEVLNQHQIRFFQVPFIDGSLGPGRKLISFLKYAKIVRSFSPDIVHAITIRAILVGAFLSTFRKPKKFVALFAGLGTVFRSEKPAFRILLRVIGIVFGVLLNRKAVRVVFMNEDDRSTFLKAVKIPSNQTEVIKGSGVDTDKFAFTPYLAEKSSRTVLMTARIIRDKGVLEFIAASGLIKQAHPEHRFLLVGDIDPGNPTSLTKAEVETLCNDARVEWLGHQSNISEILSTSDIYCLPSYHEGLSLALLEAASCGKAIVTTDIPGCRAVVEHGLSGLLVPPRDSLRLAEAVGQLLRSPNLAADFGREARRKVETTFASEKVIRRYLDLYLA